MCWNPTLLQHFANAEIEIEIEIDIESPYIPLKRGNE